MSVFEALAASMQFWKAAVFCVPNVQLIPLAVWPAAIEMVTLVGLCTDRITAIRSWQLVPEVVGPAPKSSMILPTSPVPRRLVGDSDTAVDPWTVLAKVWTASPLAP